jgi:hypothetical protein
VCSMKDGSLFFGPICLVFFFSLFQQQVQRWCDGSVQSETYERSVTWTKVSLKEAKMRATPKTSSPVPKSDRQYSFVDRLALRIVPARVPRPQSGDG